MTSEVNPRYCNDLACCAFLGIARSTWWDWVAKGRMPRPVRIFGATRWDMAEVEEAVERRH
jgi:predicted DNA-binding transcriptional regulator AlpA